MYASHCRNKLLDFYILPLGYNSNTTTISATAYTQKLSGMRSKFPINDCMFPSYVYYNIGYAFCVCGLDQRLAMCEAACPADTQRFGN